LPLVTDDKESKSVSKGDKAKKKDKSSSKVRDPEEVKKSG